MLHWRAFHLCEHQVNTCAAISASRTCEALHSIESKSLDSKQSSIGPHRAIVPCIQYQNNHIADHNCTHHSALVPSSPQGVLRKAFMSTCKHTNCELHTNTATQTLLGADGTHGLQQLVQHEIFERCSRGG